jgi:hypothetical protein
MATKSRRFRSEFIFGAIFIGIIVLAMVADWWKTHAIIGWTIAIILVIALVFSLYKYPPFRKLFTRTLKSSGEKMMYEEASAREPLPDHIRAEVYNRSKHSCENPDCRYKTSIHIHHIDMNNSNNKLFNLISLCPNCHQEAHKGVLTTSQLHNWVNADYYQLKQRRYSH